MNIHKISQVSSMNWFEWSSIPKNPEMNIWQCNLTVICP
jgi:hypothetical protein